MEFGGLKVLMLSTDSNIFTPGSAVSERMKEYGGLVDELHIVVLSGPLKIDPPAGGGKPARPAGGLKISENVWAYPTNSSLRFFRHGAASGLGSKIIKNHHFIRGRSVITSQDPFQCGLVGLKLKKKFRLPLEVQLHTDPFSMHYSGVLNKLRKNIGKKVLKQADAIRVVSESLKIKIGEYSSSTINVLPIYIDRKRIEEGKVTFDLHARMGWHFVLLCVARLTREKNLGMAIETLARVREYYADTGLVIVGSGPEEDNLRNLAKKLGVEKNVEFTGWQEDLASYYKTSNLFLQTSNFEGYGMALVEAGLSGLPAVTTNVGLAEELENGRDAYVTPVGDREFMFKAVYDLIQDGAKREMLKTNLKKKLESILLSREDYMTKIKESWEGVARQVNS